MTDYPYRVLYLIVVIILVVQGCSTARAPGEPAPVEDQSSAVADVPQTGAIRGHQTRAESQAVVALLDTAQVDMDSGRPESAAATLERALRLEPRNGVLWHRLALIRRQQGQWQQVLSLAQKSNSLAAGDRNLQLQNWRLIAEACRKLKDVRGADQAEKLIKQLMQAAGARG